MCVCVRVRACFHGEVGNSVHALAACVRTLQAMKDNKCKPGQHIRAHTHTYTHIHTHTHTYTHTGLVTHTIPTYAYTHTLLHTYTTLLHTHTIRITATHTHTHTHIQRYLALIVQLSLPHSLKPWRARRFRSSLRFSYHRHYGADSTTFTLLVEAYAENGNMAGGSTCCCDYVTTNTTRCYLLCTH